MSLLLWKTLFFTIKAYISNSIKAMYKPGSKSSPDDPNQKSMLLILNCKSDKDTIKNWIKSLMYIMMVSFCHQEEIR